MDSLKLTDVEKEIQDRLTVFLPRHMAVYDWNLPYADEIIMIVRRSVLGIPEPESEGENVFVTNYKRC